VRALVEAAHATNLLAVAHVESLDDVTIALSAGIDGIVHVWRRGGANADVVRRTAERGIFVIPVLAVQDGFLPDGRPSLLADPKFLRVLSNPIRQQLGRTSTATTVRLEELRAVQDAQLAAVRSLHAAGVRLLAGTDASRRNPTAHGISLHRELELLGQAGLSPAEILGAATSKSADAFRLTDRGRIVPGLRADMLLVRGDPTSDLLAIRDIVRIWKAGVDVDRTVVDR
jgi:imidazolonepropionase-like amidohydrolase